LNKPNLLITGCAGFIGSHAVDYFLEKGYKVDGVDCFTYAGNTTNIRNQYANPDFKLFNVNICNTAEILEICQLRSIDWIINFAAETHVDNSILSCAAFVESNINGVRSLLEICKETGIKLFHISTDEVYGDIMAGSFEEGDSLSPKNPYSATKAAAEHMVRAYANTYGIEYLMVRPSNNFGPRQHEEKFIPTIMRNLLNDKKVPIYGTGKNIREWTYVKDTPRAIEHIMLNSEMNKVYNISSSNEQENLEIVKQITELLNKDFNSSITFVPDRLGHDFRYSVDADKLKKIGFSLDGKSDFDENLRETVRFYMEKNYK
tara:strand:- start:9999 stop:10952 length:954 start_codon:yes stop_codon:yes gene_type:complete